LITPKLTKSPHLRNSDAKPKAKNNFQSLLRDNQRSIPNIYGLKSKLTLQVESEKKTKTGSYFFEPFSPNGEPLEPVSARITSQNNFLQKEKSNKLTNTAIKLGKGQEVIQEEKFFRNPYSLPLRSAVSPSGSVRVIGEMLGMYRRHDSNSPVVKKMKSVGGMVGTREFRLREMREGMKSK